MAWFAFLRLRTTETKRDSEKHIYPCDTTKHLYIMCRYPPHHIESDILSSYCWLDGLNEKPILPGGCLYQTPSHPVILSGQHTNSSQYHPDGTLERRNLVNQSYPFKFSNSNKHFPTYLLHYCSHCWHYTICHMRLLIYYYSNISNDTGKHIF